MPSRPKAKVKGPAAKHATALALFGIHTLMEQPEQREAIARVLAMSDDPRFQALAREALDPVLGHARDSFAHLAQGHGLNIHHISEEYKRIMVSDANMRGAQYLPKLVEQATVEALSIEEECPACEGTGKLIKKGHEARCRRCNGKRTIRIPGDIDRMRLIFQTYGLTGKDAGVNINMDLRKMTQPESLASLAGSVAGCIEGTVKADEHDPD